jgi:hypothetical protein
MFSKSTPVPVTQPTQIDAGPMETKEDIEQREDFTAVPATANDDDQVGYATFVAAQNSGYVPVSAPPFSRLDVRVRG